MNSGTIHAGGLELRATIAVSPPRLRVSYEVLNRSGQDIYVADAMFRLTAQGVTVDPALVYTILEDDTLTLFRGVVRIPALTQVEWPDLPFARLLPAGQTLAGTIDAAQPLDYHDPYVRPAKAELRTAAKLRLRIGWLAAKELNPPPAPKRVRGADLYRLEYFQVIDKQHLLETPLQEGSIRLRMQP